MARFLVGLETILKLGWEKLLNRCIVQPPDFDRIKPEVLLARGTEGEVVVGGLRTIAGAIVPEVDGIVLFEIGGGVGTGQSIREDGVVDVCTVDQIYVGSCCEVC